MLPAATPVTWPVFGSTVAKFVLPLVHLPPVAPLLVKNVDVFAHIEGVPLTVPALAEALTVIVTLVLTDPQLLVTVYFIVGLPDAIPVTWPVLGSMIARLSLLLLHTPPAVPFELNVMFWPTHTDVGPEMVPAFGAGSIVTGNVAIDGWPQPPEAI